MTKRLNFIYAALIFPLLQGCSREIPSDPMCRIASAQNKMPPAPAACLIKLNKKLLAVQYKGQEKLNVPNDRPSNISAQCIAHQSVWKTTGLNIKVNQLLFIDNNNIHYFACTTDGSFSADLTTLPVPEWANHYVEHIKLVDPFITTKEQWEPHVNLIKVREAYTQLPYYTNRH